MATRSTDRSCVPTTWHRRLLACGLGVALLVSACTEGAAEVPEGYQQIDHPDGTIAVPAEWGQTADVEPYSDMDPDAVLAQIPDTEPDFQLGMTVFVDDQAAPSADIVAITYSSAFRTLGAADQLRNESIEVPGASDAHLRQYTAEAVGLDGQQLRGTFIVALDGDDRPLVVVLRGTEEQLSDAEIERIVDTIRVK